MALCGAGLVWRVASEFKGSLSGRKRLFRCLSTSRCCSNSVSRTSSAGCGSRHYWWIQSHLNSVDLFNEVRFYSYGCSSLSQLWITLNSTDEVSKSRYSSSILRQYLPDTSIISTTTNSSCTKGSIPSFSEARQIRERQFLSVTHSRSWPWEVTQIWFSLYCPPCQGASSPLRFACTSSRRASDHSGLQLDSHSRFPLIAWTLKSRARVSPRQQSAATCGANQNPQSSPRLIKTSSLRFLLLIKARMLVLQRFAFAFLSWVLLCACEKFRSFRKIPRLTTRPFRTGLRTSECCGGLSPRYVLNA